MDYFSEKRFFKVLNAANYRNGYEYETGLNDLSKFIGVDGEPFECFFTDIEHIFAYLYYGPCFREVIIPNSIATITYYGECMSSPTAEIPGWYTDKVILGDLKLWTVENIKWLIENGADISVENYQIVSWSLNHNFEVFYFLEDYISNQSEELWNNILVDLQYRGFL